MLWKVSGYWKTLMKNRIIRISSNPDIKRPTSLVSSFGFGMEFQAALIKFSSGLPFPHFRILAFSSSGGIQDSKFAKFQGEIKQISAEPEVNHTWRDENWKSQNPPLQFRLQRTRKVCLLSNLGLFNEFRTHETLPKVWDLVFKISADRPIESF